jgi:catechol 2,3-dioxygenase-like lactoylglutathione lyase family enzyme
MPDLNNLKKQAKQIVRWHREGYYPVAQRIRSALPQYRDLADGAVLATPFALSDAQELIAREHGFESWQELRNGAAEPSAAEHAKGDQPQLLRAHPQLFVSDVEAACEFFVNKLRFVVRFKYGKPAFYALVQREGACLNLRFVHKPVLDRKEEPDLLSASIPVGNVKTLYLEFKEAAVPLHQPLKKQPWGAEDFIIRDPDGNLVHFTS